MNGNKLAVLDKRLQAIEARHRPRQRIFSMIVQNHMRDDAEIEAYRAEHGVTDDDMLIVRVVIPFEQRPGEAAQTAYQRERRSIGRPISDDPRHGVGD